MAWACIEPRAGVFDWPWLDSAIAALAHEGLEVVLGTPTAAPPAWLLAAHPDIAPVGADGRAKPFGARRHYCVAPAAPLAGYAPVVAPALLAPPEGFVRRLGTLDAVLVLGPRTGSKTADFAIPPTLPSGALARVLPMRAVTAASLRPGLEPEVVVAGERIGHARQWRDIAEPAAGVTVLARCADDGAPAWLRHGRCFAHTGIVDDALQQCLLGEAAQAAGLALQPLEGGLRLRRRGTWRFAFNHGPDEAAVPAPARTATPARRRAPGAGRRGAAARPGLTMSFAPSPPPHRRHARHWPRRARTSAPLLRSRTMRTFTAGHAMQAPTRSGLPSEQAAACGAALSRGAPR